MAEIPLKPEQEINEESTPQEQEPPTPQETDQQQNADSIRTTPIPIPTGAGRQARQEPQQLPKQAGSAPQQQQQDPGLRNLVRFLNNPEGAMASNDSTYLRTMYSTDSATLVLKSAMNSSGYF